MFKTIVFSLIRNEKILIFSSFLLLIFFTNINQYLFLNLGSIHLARQYDTFAFTEYYFRNNFNFFSPGNFNLGSNDGKCVSEFPIIYYLTSFLYLLFTDKILTFKLVNLILFFVGFYFSFKIIYKLLNQKFLYHSIFLNLLFYSSTVLLYYGSIFLPDIHSLTFSLAGVYYFLIFIESGKKIEISIILLTISVLLKASFFYYEASIIFYYIVFLKFSTEKKIRVIAYFTASTLVIFAWYFFANRYNQENNALYYTLSIRPIWSISNEKITKSFDMIFNYWYSKYYFQSTFHFIISIFLIGLLFLKKGEKKIFLLLMLVLNSILYIFLFLPQFIDHDYYFIVIIPTIIISTTVQLYFILVYFERFKYFSSIVLVTTIVISLLSLNYAKLNLYRRYMSYSDKNLELKLKIQGLEKYIPEHSKVLIIGDASVNVGLGVLNRFGYSIPNSKNYQVNLKEFITNVDFVVIANPTINYTYSKKYLSNFKEIKLNSPSATLFKRNL